MEEIFDRTSKLITENGFNKLKNAKILIFGIGGVGGYTFESLVRMGIEHIDIVDNDTFSPSNLNRQLYATIDTIGKCKVDVAIERAKSINPNCKVTAYKLFYLPNKESDIIDFTKYDFVIDAIDTITAKFDIVKKCYDYNVPIISCMGTGNRLDATKFKFSNICDTNNCKIAKLMRKYCNDNNIKNLTVLYSDEPAKKIVVDNSTSTPASISYVPAIAGLLLSQYVIQSLLKENYEKRIN